MSDSDFPTTILTSKSPEDVADFLPHSLQLSSQLIEKNLSVWFANYASMVARYNQDLNTLVANGRNFFTAAGAEFGSLDKIWNCVASSVMSQIQVNESLIKVIKRDVLSSFNSAFKDDFKYSELLVNSEELLEMKSHMNDANGAYNWNVKAPAILDNFENYKKFEKDLIFNAFISYLNTLNTKTSSLVHKNENAVNFILKEYHIDNEMKLYTDYMIKASVPSAEAKSKAAPPAHASPSRPQAQSGPSVASMNSGSTSGTSPVKEKRKSKLRSKVGSILGRKKKNSSLSHSETIPEDASATSVPSRSGTYASKTEARNSFQNPLSSNSRRHSMTRNEHKPMVPAAVSNEPIPSQNREPIVSTQKARTNSFGPADGKAPSTFKPAFDAAPLQPSQPLQSSMTSQPLQASQPSQPLQPLKASPPAPLEPSQASKSLQPLAPKAAYTQSEEESGPQTPIYESRVGESDEDANFVKYSSSEDESDAPVDQNGKRLSLLNAHDLGQPPKVEVDSDSRSRNTSSGKYSFEYGDETKSISTPQHTPVVEKAPASFGESHIPVIPEASANEDHTYHANSSLPEAASNNTKSFAAARPPPPPPSRKVHPVQHEAQRDSFHNLHSARDSFVPPHSNSDRMSLVSQTTGNSLLRQDQFKHFSASSEPIREGLNTSIAEIINATFKDGNVTKSQVLGEIAFNYNSNKPLDSLTVHIPTKFSKFLLNDQLMAKHGSDKYTLNLAPISGKTLGGIKYRLDSDADHVPVLVKQIWKFEPKQASLIIKLSLNPGYSKQIILDGLTISASLDSSVASISASSKPEGSFNKDFNRIAWRYTEPLSLSSGSPEVKLIARIMTTGLARESASGTKLRFTVSEGAVPNVTILDSAHQLVPSIASLSSGNYSSHI